MHSQTLKITHPERGTPQLSTVGSVSAHMEHGLHLERSPQRLQQTDAMDPSNSTGAASFWIYETLPRLTVKRGCPADFLADDWSEMLTDSGVWLRSCYL